MRVPCENYYNHKCEECRHWTDRDYRYYCPVKGCVHHPSYGMCYFVKKEDKK